MVGIGAYEAFQDRRPTLSWAAIWRCSCWARLARRASGRRPGLPAPVTLATADMPTLSFLFWVINKSQIQRAVHCVNAVYFVWIE
jgi:hypothetical protein